MRRIGAFLLVLVFFSLSLSGCYYFSAKNQLNTAGKLVADLKAQGGEQKVPYEYSSAQAFLEMAQMEFDQNDYSHSKNFSSRSISAAQAGLAAVGKK